MTVSWTPPTLTRILPALFAWREIPAGIVTLTDVKGSLARPTTFAVERFHLAEHPVTCAQFARFIDAGGYHRRDWWTEAGWEWREEARVTQPEFWWNDYFNQPNRPVVGVSFYEAIAFCNWLGDAAGASGITLPTEQQWQRAAQGHDSRVYPWGDDFDTACCNTREAGVVTTTDVDAHPDGASPFGVVDLSGNAWEWCLTEWHSGRQAVDGDETRLARGGSWFDSGSMARATFRRDFAPFVRFSYNGFRCCFAPQD